MLEKYHEEDSSGSLAAENSGNTRTGTRPPEQKIDAISNASNEDSGREGLLDLLKRTAEASLVLGALLYVIGWSYLDGYYGTFALKVGQLGVSTQEAALASFKFIFYSPWQTNLVCSGLLLLGLVGSFFYRRTGWRRELMTVALLVVVLVFSGLLSERASVLGREAAWNDMRTRTTMLPRVQIEIDSAKLSDNLINFHELEMKEYRLLLQTENRVWIFKSTDQDQLKGAISVVTLPKDTVRIIMIERATPIGGGS